ncbi:unnamed protein product [Ectocarpus sp. 12 AP-2014]
MEAQQEHHHNRQASAWPHHPSTARVSSRSCNRDCVGHFVLFRSFSIAVVYLPLLSWELSSILLSLFALSLVEQGLFRSRVRTLGRSVRVDQMWRVAWRRAQEGGIRETNEQGRRLIR